MIASVAPNTMAEVICPLRWENVQVIEKNFGFGFIDVQRKQL
jgi:hypothetical protein